MTLARRLLRSCFRFAVRFSVALWIIDLVPVVRAARKAHAPLLPLLTGLGAALFRGLALSLPPAIAIALLWWLGSLRAHQVERPSLRALGSAWLRDGSPAEALAKSGALLALLPLALFWIGAGANVCERLIVGMARPQFAALACVGSLLVLLLMAAALFPAVAGLMTFLCRGLALLPRAGARCFAKPMHYVAWLGLLGALALGLFAWRFRAPLAYLPWPIVLQLTAAAVAALAWSLLASRLPARTRLPRTAAGWALVAAAVACAVLQSPLWVYSRQISERETLSGRLGQGALLWAFDRDRDGYLPLFGGGDCAPADPARNPGATDVPGNGIDEDCDGSDLNPRATALRGKFDYPLPASVPRRPPIVLITVDAFAAKHMHALGYKRDLTPNIDALAARSVFFRDCFAQGPSTRLSFPSIFASRWDTQIEQELVGHHPFPVGPNERLLAQVLDKAGYDTAAILSDAYFSPRFWKGITRGFAHIDESSYNPPRVPHDGPRVTDAAIEELARARTKPLFLWVHYYDAHSPHEQPEDVPVLGTTREDLYDAELALVDREVGRLLAAIDKQFAGQALVVLTGDHGIAFDEPRHEQFNYGYDLHTAVLHVPLIVHAPFFAPRTLDGVVSTMDIAPTLANVLRLPGPLPYEGMSLVPELLHGTRSRPAELMHQMYIEERLWKHDEPLERVSLRTDQFNLLQDRKTGFFELYDYRNDYFETHDLALDPLYGAQLAALRKQLTVLLYNAQPHPPAPSASASAQRAAP